MVPVSSQIHRVIFANSALFYVLVERSVVEYTDFVDGRQFPIAAFSQHLTPVHLFACPVPLGKDLVGLMAVAAFEVLRKRGM